MSANERGKSYNVVWLCSTTVPGYKLVNNDKYPNIVEDYRRSFRILKSLPCDVFLASHGSFFDLATKMERMRVGGTTNRFVNPAELKEFLQSSEAAFEKNLEAQQAAKN
jgi:metallo-beta-lactamase class B